MVRLKLAKTGLLILLLPLISCSQSNKLSPSLIAPIKIIDPKLDDQGRLTCDAAIIWGMEQMPHVKEAQDRLKKLREDQESSWFDW